MSRQVLLINITRMGDLVQMGALLHRLQQEQAGTAVDLVVDQRFATVAAMLPHLRRVVTYDFHRLMDESRVQALDVVSLFRDMTDWAAPLVEAGYDRVVNLTFNRRSGFLTSYVGAREIRGVAAAKDGDAAIHNPWMAYLTDMHHYRRVNQFNLVDIYALGGSGTGSFAPLSVAVPADATDWAGRFLAQADKGAADWIAVQVGASDPMKAWRAESFGQTLASLTKRTSVGVAFIGTEEEREAIATAHRVYRQAGGVGPICEAVGRTSLPQLAALLSRCRLLLTNDTGPMHLAVAVGTPVVNLSVGHVDFRETGPYGPGHWVVQPDIACAPCGFDQVCFHHACKDHVVPEQVASLCLHVLGKAARPGNWGGVRVYESCTDEDGFGSYRLQAGVEEPLSAWYGRFWRRYWFSQFTGQESKVGAIPGVPPDIGAVRAILNELTPLAARLVAQAGESVRLSRQRPLPVRALQELQRAERTLRSQVLSMSQESLATAPLAMALLRDTHADDGDDLTGMAQSRLATYRRWQARLRLVAATCGGVPVGSDLARTA